MKKVIMYIIFAFFYNNEDCLSTRYTSLEECMRDFEYLVRCLSFGIQFIDMTNIS